MRMQSKVKMATTPYHAGEVQSNILCGHLSNNIILFQLITLHILILDQRVIN